jgi:predicted transposase/invertase (TIGR01784 family)
MTKNNDTDLTNKSDTEVIKIARKLTSPKSDFWFKKIFGEHKDICKNFIESVTGLHINSLEYGNTESLGDLFGTKKICFDVNAIIDNGMRVNIEMQIEDRQENVDRFALYATRYHGAQLKAGEKYNGITKTIVIHVFDYIFLDKDRYKCSINKYQLLHVTEHTLLSDTLDIYVIELPKIPKTWHNECEKWLSWLNNREEAVKKGVTMHNQYIANAEAVYNIKGC